MIDGVDWAEKVELEKADAKTSISDKAQIEDVPEPQVEEEINSDVSMVSTYDTTHVEVQRPVNTDTQSRYRKTRRRIP